jgi:hypothetical protein
MYTQRYATSGYSPLQIVPSRRRSCPGRRQGTHEFHIGAESGDLLVYMYGLKEKYHRQVELGQAAIRNYPSRSPRFARAPGVTFRSDSLSNLGPLMTLRQVDLICHLWQQYVNTALLLLAPTRKLVCYDPARNGGLQ